MTTLPTLKQAGLALVGCTILAAARSGAAPHTIRLAVGGVPPTGAQASIAHPGVRALQTVTMRLYPVAPARVHGTALLTAVDGGTRVVLDVRGLPPGARAVSLLHGGTCSHFGASVTVVVALRAGTTGQARATGRLLFHGRENVRLSVLTDGDHVMVITRGAQVVACGTIPRMPSPALSAHVKGGGVLRIVGVGKAPMAVAVDVRANRAFVVNSGDNSVSLLDARSGSVLRTVPLRNGAVEKRGDRSTTAVDDERTSRIFVVNQRTPPANSSVSVLDARSGIVLRTTRVGLLAAVAAVDGRTQRVFVTNLDSNTVSVLDARSGARLRTIPVGMGPGDVAVDERAGRVFVANGYDGTVSVLDAGTGTLRRTISTGQRGQGVAVVVVGLTGHVFAFNQNGRMSVLDPATGTVVRTVALGMFPGGAAMDERTGRIFITAPGSNMQGHRVGMLDARSGALLRTIAVGGGPLGVAVDAATERAFIGNNMGNSVSILNARTGTVLRTISVSSPWALAVDAQTHRCLVVNVAANTVSVLDTSAPR
jgi:YVTN family beta-propeller protein